MHFQERISGGGGFIPFSGKPLSLEYFWVITFSPNSPSGLSHNREDFVRALQSFQILTHFLVQEVRSDCPWGWSGKCQLMVSIEATDRENEFRDIPGRLLLPIKSILSMSNCTQLADVVCVFYFERLECQHEDLPFISGMAISLLFNDAVILLRLLRLFLKAKSNTPTSLNQPSPCLGATNILDQHYYYYF